MFCLTREQTILCQVILQGTSPSSDVLSDKGTKSNGESKGSKGGSPFEEGAGDEVKHALQEEQGHDSPTPTAKQSTEDDKTSASFRYVNFFLQGPCAFDLMLRG